MSAVEVFHGSHRATKYRAFAPEDQRRVEGRLPVEMIELLSFDGFASYADQLLWSVDPDDIGDVVAPWLPGSETIVPLFRTAFGSLFLYDGKRVYYSNVHLHTAAVCAPRMRF